MQTRRTVVESSENRTTPGFHLPLRLFSIAFLWWSILLSGHHRCCAYALELKSWNSCAFNSDLPADVECTTAIAPLCYEGICEDSSNHTVKLAVKRIMANNNSNSATTNVWYISDQTDTASASAVESQMTLLYQELLGKANVYSLDTRGTGAGDTLDCFFDDSMNQSNTTSNSESTELSTERTFECIINSWTINKEQLAAFSITSVANDVASFITQYQANSSVFVYGLGYATALVERLMHFGLPEIKGYVLDGIAATPGAANGDFDYFSKADAAFGEIADEFLALCASNESCASIFTKQNVTNTLRDLLSKLDRNDSSDSACASILATDEPQQANVSPLPASFKLRKTLGTLLQNATIRAFIPAVIYRLNRCATQDVEVLQTFFEHLQNTEQPSSDEIQWAYTLQTFSELWETPIPSDDEVQTRFTDALISDGKVWEQWRRYRAFLNQSLTTLDTDDGNTIITYQQDGYWNTTASIPANASVLILNGRFDGRSPVKYAEAFMKNLDGEAAALLVFDTGSYNILNTDFPIEISVEESSRSSVSSFACGRAIVASYIQHAGALINYDVSCLEKIAEINLAVTEEMSLELFNVSDAYNGVLDEVENHTESNQSNVKSDSSTSSSTNETVSTIEDLKASVHRYKVALIVTLIVLVAVLLMSAVVGYCWWRKQQLYDEEQKLRRMRGEEVDDLMLLRELLLSSSENWVPTLPPVQPSSSEIYGSESSERRSEESEEFRSEV